MNICICLKTVLTDNYCCYFERRKSEDHSDSRKKIHDTSLSPRCPPGQSMLLVNVMYIDVFSKFNSVLLVSKSNTVLFLLKELITKFERFYDS